MAGKITLNEVVLGDHATPANNFVLKTNADGTASLKRNADGSGGDILTVGADGDVKLKKTNATSMVRLNTANGYGSTNTVIRRFTNVVTNQGSDITYADSVTLGASFTINTNGVYTISHADQVNSANDFALSLNSTQLSTICGSILTATRLAFANSASANACGTMAWTGYLSVGDVVRTHGNGAPSGTAPDRTNITITRVA